MPPRNAIAAPRAGRGNQEMVHNGRAILAVTDTWLVDPAFVLRVEVNDRGDQRVYIYRTLSSAQRAVQRAEQRGRDATVTLCELVPVGVS
jgi:hypothetical protein